MSNEVAVFSPGQVPAFARNRKGLSAIGAALTAGGGNSKRISIKGGVFRLIAGGKQVAAIDERYLDVVIVAAAPATARKFYKDGYDENNPSPPDCWSNDGETPDAKAKARQCDTCAGCPQNIAGSGRGDSRACRFEHRIAVVLANDMGGNVMGMTIPAESLFAKDDGENRALKGYARYLAAQNVDPAEVITRMKFDTAAATPKLFFKPMRWLTDDEFGVCTTQGATPDAQDAITLTVAAQDGVKGTSAPIESGLGARPQRTAKQDADPKTGETTPPPAAQQPAATPAVDPALEAKKKAAAAKAAAARAAAEAAAAEAAALEAEVAAAEGGAVEPPPPAPGAGVKRGSGTTRAKAAAQVVDVVTKAENAVAAGEPSEPTVRGGEAAATAVEAKTGLASMVDEWDDES